MSVIKVILGLLFFVLVVGLLVFYWFLPSGTFDFNIGSRNYNFSVDSEFEEMQFYENMRFPSSEISYKILDCPLQKEDEMEYAFEILSDTSVLNFYPVESGEEITITCDDENKIEGGLFIAGEGGPTNITDAGEFSVIQSGKILLIRKSNCERPNVALHELFHVLGYKHSDNRRNILYPTSKCGQVVGDDLIESINYLYSFPTYPDLVLENISSKIDGRLLDTNVTVRNNGLKDAGSSVLVISADGKEIKRVDVGPLRIGFGRMMMLTNVFVSNFVVDEIKFEIIYNSEELEKENNKIELKIRN
jgi:hypothetical protein